jgi:hypothetical protein
MHILLLAGSDAHGLLLDHEYRASRCWPPGGRAEVAVARWTGLRRFVQALGSRLEVIAHVDDKTVKLRGV